MSMRAIGFLHTSPVHVATFDGLLAASGVDVRAVHVVDESLLAEARADGVESVRWRLAARLAEVVREDVDVVCCTCSTLGGLAEELALSKM